MDKEGVATIRRLWEKEGAHPSELLAVTDALDVLIEDRQALHDELKLVKEHLVAANSSRQFLTSQLLGSEVKQGLPSSHLSEEMKLLIAEYVQRCVTRFIERSVFTLRRVKAQSWTLDPEITTDDANLS
jgi:hypothetical protein